MSAFEKWQAFNGVASNALLLARLLAAAYIGLKQAEISVQQTQINQKLLHLEYSFSCWRR
jgi:hypothetical protein